MRNRLLVTACFLALGACDPSPPSGGDAGGDTGSSDPCGIHTTCEACADESVGSANCDWCAGSCVTRPSGISFDDESWCDWGHAHIGSRCTETDGARILPTDLPVDCRHSRNVDDPACDDSNDRAGMVGAGVRFPNDVGGPRIENGFLDASSRTIYVAATQTIAATSSGTVYAVDLDTGDRTIVTGTYEDPRTGVVTVGTGPDIGAAFDVERHPSGDLVVWGAAGWFRVDAAGNRTLIHASDAYCVHGGWEWNFPNDVVQHDMIVDSMGRVLVPLGYARPGGPDPMAADENYGIARLDGATCTILTMASLDARFAVGTGRIPLGHFQYLWLDGASILANTTFGRVFRIDPSTGDRTVVSAVQDGVGSGGTHEAQPGEWGFFARADMLFAVRGETRLGVTEPLLGTEIDVASGDVTPRFNATDTGTGLEIGLNQANWAAPHPDDADWVVVSTERFIALAELSSGNVNLLSF